MLLEFIQNEFRSDQFMMPDTMIKKLAADSTRDESCNKDVRVKNDFHETRSNTSSAVRIPFVCADAIICSRKVRS